jgi:hypothetical protein
MPFAYEYEGTVSQNSPGISIAFGIPSIERKEEIFWLKVSLFVSDLGLASSTAKI